MVEVADVVVVVVVDVASVVDVFCCFVFDA